MKKKLNNTLKSMYLHSKKMVEGDIMRKVSRKMRMIQVKTAKESNS